MEGLSKRRNMVIYRRPKTREGWVILVFQNISVRFFGSPGEGSYNSLDVKEQMNR